MSTDLLSLTFTVVNALGDRTLATAESLTGGQIGATITSIPGTSKVYRGGVISYASDLKVSMIDVPQSLLDNGGAVQAEVALAMARGVATNLNADFGLAVTGVAGPEPQDGKAPGTVFVACVQRDTNGTFFDQEVEELHFSPEVQDPREIRAEIRTETVAAALELLMSLL